MDKIILHNKYTGDRIAEVCGEIVKTDIGTFRVEGYDLKWLINEAPRNRDFSALDIRMIGDLISKK